MSSNPFDFVVRMLGIEARDLLSELEDVDRDNLDWNGSLDANVDWANESNGLPRRSRRGIGVRPGRRLSSPNPNRNDRDQREQWSCPSCERNFRSHRGLQRHYDTNPEHADAVIDIDRELEQGEGASGGSEWVEFDDRVETFRKLPEEVDESEITVTHDATNHCVRISGAHEEPIDTNPVSETIDGEVEWRTSGRYLVLLFPL
ncbi:hypothetical protein PNP59_07600 [Halobacterium salinarum]|uniref:C2H2-type domain-containing protein n=1 Tax=Halorubrum laminariae TaxID=1433523 RepID=A0ABD6C402_9EURY|nr:MULTISPECIES: hypothetical protein [Halobacteria]MDL0130806.1 hypothetical protein [Halobacterium salinarum]